MSHTLTFVYHPAEISSVLPALDTRVIALNPNAQAALQKQGVAVTDLQPYLTTAVQAEIINKAARLTDWLRANFQYRDEHGLSLGYQESLVWSERLIIIHCLWALEILSHTVVAHKPALLQAALPSKCSTEFIMETDEHYFGELAQQFALRHGIEFRQIPIQPKPVNFQHRLAKTDDYLSTTILRPLCALIGQRQLRQLSKSPALISGTDRYNLPAFTKEISQSFSQASRVLLVEGGLVRWFFKSRPEIFTYTIPLIFLESLAQPHSIAAQTLQHTLQTLVSKILQAPEIFTHCEVSFAPILAEYLQKRLFPFLQHLHQRAAALKLLLNAAHPIALFSAGNRADDILLGELCRQQEVPALLISHGSHTAPLTQPAQQEWLEHSTHLIRAPYPAVALQTPPAEEFLKVLPSPLPTQLLKTGALLWGRPADLSKGTAYRQKILAAHPEARFILVHAGTTKFPRAARLFVYETPEEYLQSLRDLVQVVSEIPPAHLVIRFRPMPQLLVAELQALVPFPPHVTLSVTETFEEVLGAADLLVSFSSTTIEEALQNKVPVLLYGAEGRYQHLPAVEVSAHPTLSAPAAVYSVAHATELRGGLLKIMSFTKSDYAAQLFARYLYAESERDSLIAWLTEKGFTQ